MARPKIHSKPAVVSISLDRAELARIDRSCRRTCAPLGHRSRSAYVRSALRLYADIESDLDLLDSIRGEIDCTRSEYLHGLIREAALALKHKPWVTEGTQQLIARIK